MKLKKTDINLLIMLAGVLIALASYFLVFTNYNEKTAALEAENATLSVEVDELQKLADNKDQYIKETERMNTEIDAIIAEYPIEVRTEDQIMYAVALENTNSIWINAMEMGNAELVQVAVAADTTQDAVVEDDGTQQDTVVASAGLQDTVFLYRTPYKYSFKATYRSVKDIVEAIVTSDERMNITTLALAYDSDTGCLVGSMDMSMYTMSGTGKYYEELDIPGVSIGTDDFFQSGTVLNLNTNVTDDATEEGEESEESSEEEVTED